MISIQLNPTIFSPGGMFYGTDQNRAVLHCGVGRNDVYLGKIQAAYPLTSLSYRGGQCVLLIDAVGTQIDDRQFATIMQNDTLRYSYGSQILDFVQRGLIRVYQDGILLTATQVDTFA